MKKYLRNNYPLYFLLVFFISILCLNFCIVSAHAQPVLVKAYSCLPGEFMATAAQSVSDAEMQALYLNGTGFSNTDMANCVAGLADRLLAKQNGDGGWSYELNGALPSVPKISGAVGLGMLRAYLMKMKIVAGTEDDSDGAAYLTAATNAKNYLLNNKPILSGIDYIFLYQYMYWTTSNRQASSHADYATVNNTLLNYLASTGSAALYAGFQATEPQLANWWAAEFIDACKLFGGAACDAFADGLVAAALPCWVDGAEGAGAFVFDTTNNYVRTLDHARMIEVLAKYYRATHLDYINKGVKFLKDIQGIPGEAIGLFRAGGQITPGGTVTGFTSVIAQDQSFAVSAMAFARQTTSGNYTQNKGTYRGAEDLMGLAVARGTGLGFVDAATMEYSEDNAEGICALYASCREGDVNKSGVVLSNDSLAALKASIGSVNLTGPEFVSADMNGNGYIESQDALSILKKGVGQDIPTSVF